MICNPQCLTNVQKAQEIEMITLYRTDKSIIGTFPVDSVKEAVELAVRQGISLEDANLKRVDIKGAKLKGADFEGADLESTNLTNANLKWANCKGANLTNANLTRANLSSVDLMGAVLTKANFTDANFDFAAISLQCKSTEAIVDDRFAAQLAHLLTRQDYSNCSEEVKRDIDIIKSLPITNLLAKYRNEVKLI